MVDGAMSRSRKKTPVMSTTTCDSEKEDKRIANRAERHTNKRILVANLDETKLKDRREISDVWSMGKDGKGWMDISKFPEEMRK